eukprot:3875126-Pleurochrysis_carterae.AAC.1
MRSGGGNRGVQPVRATVSRYHCNRIALRLPSTVTGVHSSLRAYWKFVSLYLNADKALNRPVDAFCETEVRHAVIRHLAVARQACASVSSVIDETSDYLFVAHTRVY